MTEDVQSTLGPNSKFGWPKPARIVEFQNLQKKADLPTTRIVFQGRPQDISIIRVPIDLPKYRMANGRTASLQVEYLAKHPKERRDLFSGDSELWDAQEAQHKLLVQLGRQAELSKYFENTANAQVEAILLDENGFVINGNRRLSTWRQLLADDPDKYGHFRHIDVAVLPHCSDREIDRLEATLQVQKDIRADYNWDALANMMHSRMRGGVSPQELAELYGMKQPEVQELLDMRSYASEYLKSRGKENIWSEVSPHEFAFRRLVQWRVKVSGVAKQELFKEAAFALIDDPNSVGRLYEAIPALAANLDQVTQRLAQEFTVESVTPSKPLEELFGGGITARPNLSDAGIVAALKKPETIKQARDVIADVLESQRQLKRDTKTTGYLLESCAKANATLTSAVKDGLRPESKTIGVAAQLDEIEAHVAKIRKFLTKNA